MEPPHFLQTSGDGLTIQLAEWPGEARTVLALYGLTANCLCWGLLAPALTPEQWARVSTGIKPSLDRLGHVFPSFAAYLEHIRSAPFLQP